MLELDSVWKFMECDVGMDGGGYIRLRAPCCAPARWVFRSDGAPNNAQQHQDLHRNRQRTPTRLWLASARTARRHRYHLDNTGARERTLASSPPFCHRGIHASSPWWPVPLRSCDGSTNSTQFPLLFVNTYGGHASLLEYCKQKLYKILRIFRL